MNNKQRTEVLFTIQNNLTPKIMETVEKALNEAEKRGMLRAAEIAKTARGQTRVVECPFEFVEWQIRKALKQIGEK